VRLETLQLKRNRICKFNNGLEDLLGLLECPTLTVLDISDNFIEGEEVIVEIFEKLPIIAVLYLQGNPFTKKVRNYRKSMISHLPTLKYLDDRPVFDDDRSFAEAFARGGIEEERKERERIKKEKDDAHWKNHEAFLEMVRVAREEKRVADEAKKLAAASSPLALAEEEEESQD